MNVRTADKYAKRLKNFPQPGEGRHTEILGVANLGIIAGKTLLQIHSDIRNAVDGSLPDSEIHSAILKAASDHHAGGTYRPPPRPAPLIKDGRAARRRIIEQGTINDDADLWEASLIRLYDATEQDSILLLETLFAPDEFVFIGDRYDDGIIGQTIRRVSKWIEFFQAGGKAGPFVIVNPFTGKAAPKKDGDGETYRGDGCVSAFKHCLVEFDNLSREEQIRFWSAAKLPILALIDTGGKSIHAWLDVKKLYSISNCEQWNQEIKTKLYERVLVPLGVDRACCNPARLSRLPGHLRAETGKMQRLLWLSPEGRKVVL